MKLTPEMQRKLVWEALMKTDGNREKAAKLLTVSPRTFYRYIRDLDLYAELDKMGWTSRPGPPRSVPKKTGASSVRLRILAHVRRRAGDVDIGELAIEIYNRDDRRAREFVYQGLDALVEQGRLAVVGERWVVIDEKKGKTA